MRSCRVFTNILGDLDLILGCVIPKTLKMVLDTSLLNTQWYKIGIKGRVEQSSEMSSTFPTPRCKSYWKGTLLVALDYGRQPITYEELSLYLILLDNYYYYYYYSKTIHYYWPWGVICNACLIFFSSLLLHIILILHLFMIANNIRCVIDKLWSNLVN